MKQTDANAEIKSFDDVCMGKKLLIFSELVMKDPSGAIIVPISPLEKYLMSVSFGQPYIEMPIQYQNLVITIQRQGKISQRIDASKQLSKFEKSSMKLKLNELNELRDQAYENSLIYKERTKKLHDSKIKNLIFNVGDRVLLFNTRLKMFSGKLKLVWVRLSVRGNSRRTKNDRVKYEWDAKQGLVENLKSSCTDNANIIRKRSKAGQTRTREWKEYTRARSF
ncbi:hypothetical protein Tco_0897035 [Tanacetum coccineum]